MWTHDEVKAMKELRARGYSATDIAAALGGKHTRNAVIGKLYRLGIPCPDNVEPTKPMLKVVRDEAAELGKMVTLPECIRLVGLELDRRETYRRSKRHNVQEATHYQIIVLRGLFLRLKYMEMMASRAVSIHEVRRVWGLPMLGSEEAPIGVGQARGIADMCKTT